MYLKSTYLIVDLPYWQVSAELLYPTIDVTTSPRPPVSTDPPNNAPSTSQSSAGARVQDMENLRRVTRAVFLTYQNQPKMDGLFNLLNKRASEPLRPIHLGRYMELRQFLKDQREREQ